MGYYRYEGRDRKGFVVAGSIKANSLNDAKQKLIIKGISTKKLEEKTGILYRDLPVFNKAIPFKELVIFIRQFSTLIKAGITILDATSILKDQATSKKMKSILGQVLEDLSEGYPFSEAAAKHPHVFPTLFSNMLRAGEAGGQFDEILDRLAVYYEKSHTTRQKVRSAMTYPLVLLAVSVLVIVFMIGFIVPRFAGMFATFGADLPWSTQLLLTLSSAVTSYWWMFLIAIILFIFIYQSIKSKPHIRYHIDSFLLKIPVFGSLLKKAILARMTRTLSTLYESSVPVTQALLIVEKVVGNAVIEKLLRESSISVTEGNSIAQPFVGHWAVPPFVSQMMILGEKSGTLDFMLDKVADFYEQEVDQSAEQLKTLLEPMLILFIAVVIGGVVASIMIPMFSIFTEIQ
jgi:type IV pilus assembly protein PilC